MNPIDAHPTARVELPLRDDYARYISTLIESEESDEKDTISVQA